MIAWMRTHRRLTAILAGGLLLVAGAGAFIAIQLSAQGDVSHPNVAFTAPVTTTATAPPKPARDLSFSWPLYGYDAARTKTLPLDRPLRPPFRRDWALTGSVLLEFPPVLGGRSLFILKNNAALYGLSRFTGAVKWKRHLGALAASSPAYGAGTLYVTILARESGGRAGRVVAVAADDGHIRWSRPLPSRTESSPLLAGGHLYFGSENGTVYSLRAADGSVQWTYKAGGAVKAGLALSGGRLYFGDYSGQVYAIHQSDGHQVWRKGTSGGAFGLSSGTFYATPAVAYGRVYLGNTDGNMYSYSATDGSLAWRTGTGNYVYSSPAVAHVAGAPPLVYAGSYDGTMYAFDARSGKVRWRHAAEGKISGGITILGDLLFYSTLNHHTTALGAATGRKVWTTLRGAYNPVVSDGCRIFLVGSTSLFSLKARPHCSGDPARR